MLIDLLRRIAEGGVCSISKLTKDLSLSEELAQQMIAQLEQRGYLHHSLIARQDLCSTCPLANSCTPDMRLQIWTLTPKGMRAIGPIGKRS